MYMWQCLIYKLVGFIGSMLFIASALALMFCYNRTENVQFLDPGIARELVLTSAVFSLILAGPMLFMFSFFEKLSDIKRNPRGRLVIQNTNILHWNFWLENFSRQNYRLWEIILYFFIVSRITGSACWWWKPTSRWRQNWWRNARKSNKSWGKSNFDTVWK